MHPIAELLNRLADLYKRYGLHGARREIVDELQQLERLPWRTDPRLRAEWLAHGWLRLIWLRPGTMTKVERTELRVAAIYAELVTLSAAGSFPTETMGIGEGGMDVNPYRGDLQGAIAVWKFMLLECRKVVAPSRELASIEGKVGFAHGLNPIIGRLQSELLALESAARR